MIHHQILKIMEKLGYAISQKGVCFGLSHMAMQAFLAEDLESYDQRLLFTMQYTPDELVKRLNEALKKRASIVSNWNEMEAIWEQKWGKPIEKLTEEQKNQYLTLEDRQLIDLLPFFEGIRAYQNPQTLTEYFSFSQVPQYQDATPVISLVEPNRLKKSSDMNDSHLSEVGVFSGQYSNLGLSHYLYLLGKYSKENQCRVSFLLHTLEHSLTIHYDPVKDLWYLSGPNQLPSKQFHNKKDLVGYVLGEMNEQSGCSFVTKVFVNKDNEAKWKVIAQALDYSHEWQKLHKVDKARAAWVGYHEQSWLHKAVFTNDIVTVRDLIAHGANVNSGVSLRPIHIAADRGYMDVLNLLLAEKADCNVEHNGKLPLTRAVFKGHLSMVQKLLPLTQKAQDTGFLDFLAESASADVAACILQYKKMITSITQFNQETKSINRTNHLFPPTSSSMLSSDDDQQHRDRKRGKKA